MDNDTFEKYLAEAIDSIPDTYLNKMKHVAILLEDEPTEEQRQKLGLRPCDALYGLYEGIPLPQRNGATLTVTPDRITIFKHPMVEHFPDDKSLRRQIKETVWHEVGHLFGLDHSMIHAAKKRH